MSSFSRHCEICDVDWPDFRKFYTCPTCQGATGWKSEPSITEAQADALVITEDAKREKREAFEAYCAGRDAPWIEAEVEKLRYELSVLWLEYDPGPVA